MKNTFKLAIIALGFAAFTTSCNKTEKAADNAVESTETTVNEATTPEAGDTAVVRDKESDEIIEKDSAEAAAAAKSTTTTTTTTETEKK